MCPVMNARYAEQVGLKGIALEDPEKISDAWDAALSADRPTVIDAKTKSIFSVVREDDSVFAHELRRMTEKMS